GPPLKAIPLLFEPRQQPSIDLLDHALPEASAFSGILRITITYKNRRSDEEIHIPAIGPSNPLEAPTIRQRAFDCGKVTLNARPDVTQVGRIKRHIRVVQDNRYSQQRH